MSFIEKELDYFLFMQLKDLASNFMKKEVDVQYNQVSFLDIYTPKVTISSFWENRRTYNHFGEKSDVYLRALGNYHYSDRQAIIHFLNQNQNSNVPSFRKQMLSFLEDLRLQQKIIAARPGTGKAFQFRKKEYRLFFQDQLKVNYNRGFKTDTLFCYLCLIGLDGVEMLDDNVLPIPSPLLIKLKEKLLSVFDCEHTIEVLDLLIELDNLLVPYLNRDMINTYFTLPKIEELPAITEEDETFDELLPTWTRKRKKETKETFLQFDDVDGEHQEMKFNETPRESEATDQVMASVQGNSKQTELNEHGETTSETNENDSSTTMGKENRYAVAIMKEPEAVTNNDIEQYEQAIQQVMFEKKRLIKVLSELLERKREVSFRSLHFGRLDKKLYRWLTDDNPKLFTKKEEMQTFDSTFSLLVDCSSSMMNKMDQVKQAIVLFHETLRELNVPHSVTGFWEDGMDSDDQYQPNYFQEAISFEESLHKNIGPAIMKLEPEEDNRDGFAIRYIGRKLARRSEKNKILMVLTDGKPAAFNYFQNGIMDTKEAIQEMNKLGIQTIGIQLDKEDEQQEKMMEAMYNRAYIMIENVDGLASQFAFVLRKMLVSSNR